MRSRWPDENTCAAFVVVVIASMLAFNHAVPLFDQDEGAYAGIALQMLRSGNWVTPEFMWSEIHRKPPGLFWLMACSYVVFGVNRFAVRLPGVLSVLLTLLAVWKLAPPLVSRRTARLAAIVLCTTAMVPMLGRIAVTDGPLLLCETVALLSLGHIVRNPDGKHVALFWFSVGAGMLVKGPPMVIVAGGTAIFCALFHPQRRNLLALRPWLWGPLSALPLLTWGWLAWEDTDGELIRWMIDWYGFRRVDHAVLGQEGPPGYHLASFCALLFPWFLLFPFALKTLCTRAWKGRSSSVFMVGWLLSGWVVFEFMRSKLPTYALAAYPALALLLAAQVLSSRRKTWWRFCAVGGLAAVVIVGGPVNVALGGMRSPFPEVAHVVGEHSPPDAVWILGRSLNAWPSLPFELQRESPDRVLLEGNSDVIRRAARQGAPAVLIGSPEEQREFLDDGEAAYQQRFTAFSLDHFEWVELWIVVNSGSVGARYATSGSDP